MKRFPYPVGTAVSGKGFSGTVTALRSPFDVVLDDRLTVPTSLILSAEPPAPPPAEDLFSEIMEASE